MKVEILTNLGTNDYPTTPFREGEVRVVEDALGALLVKRKHAREIVDLKAVPPIEIQASATVEAEPVETTAAPVPPPTPRKPDSANKPTNFNSKGK